MADIGSITLDNGQDVPFAVRVALESENGTYLETARLADGSYMIGKSDNDGKTTLLHASEEEYWALFLLIAQMHDKQEMTEEKIMTITGRLDPFKVKVATNDNNDL